MFGFHPTNLVFRLALELVALVSIGLGAYTLTDSFGRWILALGLPLAVAVVWGVFNVPGDKSRSGKAPVAVPGVVRLLIELTVFGFGVYMLSLVSVPGSMVLGALVVVHYLISIDRIRWLLAN